MKKTDKNKKGVKPFRRGGLWYDPMCFPEFDRKAP